MSEINLHRTQSPVFREMFCQEDNRTRYGVVAASRGFGKSILGGAAVTQAVGELTALPSYIPNKRIVVAAPTYSQVTDIFYPMLAYQFGLESWANKSSRYDGSFEFPNAVELKLVSGEAIERERGKGIYFLLVDELTSFNMKESEKLDMWESVLQPCIATRWSPKRAAEYSLQTGLDVNPGKALFISTTKGFDTFYDLHSKTDDHWASWSYDYTQSPYIDVAEVEAAARSMDPIRFNREYRAKFEDSGTSVFYMYNREANLVPDNCIEVHPEEPLHFAIDFNVTKQCTSVWVIRGIYAICVDYFFGSADTHQLCAAIKGRYVTEQRPASKIYTYPDPSGKARKTSAVVGTTDFTIIESYGFKTLAHNAHPGIVDSVAAVNAKLKCADNPITGAKGVSTMFVMKRCKPVYESLAKTTWVDKNPDSAMIDKSQGNEHYSDGIRYFAEYHWPIKAKRNVVRGFGF